jgi:hypothetical protein
MIDKYRMTIGKEKRLSIQQHSTKKPGAATPGFFYSVFARWLNP